MTSKSSQMCVLRIFTGGGSFQNTDHAKLACFPFSHFFSCKTVISTILGDNCTFARTQLTTHFRSVTDC